MPFVLVLLLLSGCISLQPSGRSVTKGSTLPADMESDHEEPAADSALTENTGASSLRSDSLSTDEETRARTRQQLLLDQAESWSGTPHRWGGTSRAGIDCSALVQTIYSDLFDVELPRTTRDQSRLGTRVPLSRLEIGDLLFYRINARTRHVGIYVGNNEFLHASKSDGVAISSLNDPYWKNRFWKARRLLPPDPGSTEPSDSNRERISW